MTLLQLLVGALAGAAAAPVIAAAAGKLTATTTVAFTGRIRLWLSVGSALAGAAVAGLHSPVQIALYALFAAAALTAATVDAVELRIPDRITYPTLAVGVLVLPMTADDHSWAVLLAPLLGAVASGVWALVMALVADQGLGDIKLAMAIGAWTAHLGVLPWILGVLLSQIAVAGVVAASVRRNRRSARTGSYTALGPPLTVGALLAIGIAANL